MLLINRDVLRRSIHFTCRCVDDLLHTVNKSSLADVECPTHIGINVCAGRFIRVRNWDQSREMKDEVNVLGDLYAEVWIANIPGNHLDFRQTAEVFQPSPEIK